VNFNNSKMGRILSSEVIAATSVLAYMNTGTFAVSQHQHLRHRNLQAETSGYVQSCCQRGVALCLSDSVVYPWDSLWSDLLER